MSNDSTRALTPELIDELCSADIDGELDAACAELGINVDDARAAIAASSARRDALTRAGVAVGETLPGDELDELERRRIVRFASGRAPHANVRDRRRAVLLGAAAVIAAVAIVAVVVSQFSGNDSSNKASSAKASATTVAPPTTVNLGVVQNGPDLARKFEAFAAGHASGSAGASNGSPAADSTRAASKQTGGQFSTESNAPHASGGGAAAGVGSPATGVPTRCLTTLPAASDATGVEIVATARLHGEWVAVARGLLRGRPALWAFRPADCSVVAFYNGTGAG
jgi:hypothetical protein